MRLLITTNTLAPGGAERQRVLLANELALRGHSLTLQILQSDGDLLAAVSSNVEVIRRSYATSVLPCHVVITGTTRTEAAVGLQGRFRGRAWIAAVHNPVGPGAPGLPRDVSMALRLAHSRIALSESHADWAQNSLGVHCSEVIPNGVDRHAFASVRAFRASRHAADYEYDIGFLGRLSSEHKGLDTLLEALATSLLSRRRLLIGGAGPDEQVLRQTSLDLGVADRVVLAGSVAPEHIFRSCAVVAMPSRYEGQPMVLLEALAAGVPVVASAFSSARDYLSPHRIVPVGDHLALAKALSNALRQPDTEVVTLPTVKGMVDAYEALAISLGRS